MTLSRFSEVNCILLIEVTVAGAESNTLRDRCQQLPKIISCVSGDAFIAVLKNCIPGDDSKLR
jgi:hypothetical protein